jgi:hypothetical protein
MGVNGNPHVGVTAVIGDRSNDVHGRRFSRPLGESDEEEKESESLAEREAFERRIENELGFQLAV